MNNTKNSTSITLRLKQTKGIFWFVLSVFIYVISDVLVKDIENEMHFFQVAFFGFLFSAITLIPFILKFGITPLKTTNFSLHFFRSTLLFGATILWFFGLNIVQITTATVIGFSLPLFTLIFAFLILKERVNWQRTTATLIGFLGVIIVLNPSQINFQPITILIILSSAMYATLDVVNKKFVLSETKVDLLFYLALFGAIMACIPSIFFWITPTIKQLFSLALLGSNTNLVLYCTLKAFELTDASFLAPFQYIELIISGMLGYIIFHEIPTSTTLTGAIIIITSTLFIGYTEAKNKTNLP